MHDEVLKGVPVTRFWAAEGDARGEAYDGWVDLLRGAQGLSWTPAQIEDKSSFSASIRHTSFVDVDVIESKCGFCGGIRDSRTVARDQADRFAVLIYKSGSEEVRFGSDCYRLSAGDVFIWDSTRETSFSVTEYLHKVAVFLPLRMLRDARPADWNTMPRKLSAQSGGGVLLNALLSAFACDDLIGSEVGSRMISESVMSIIAASDSQPDTRQSTSIRLAQKQRIKRHIEQELRNPNLTIQSIAERNRISTRYLHWVFSDEPCTISQYIINLRLRMCHQDLTKARNSHLSVGELAYSWGFRNASHFSNRYKLAYNESPSATRARYFGKDFLQVAVGGQ